MQHFFYLKNICNIKSVNEIQNIYRDNNLTYLFKKFSKTKLIKDLIPFLKNDKKNNDEKINFILIRAIGKTSRPNQNKITLNELKKISKSLLNSNF